MESPLQQLLLQVEVASANQVAAAQSLSPEAAAIATAAQAAATADAPLQPDVLSVLLNPAVQGCVSDGQHVASCKQRGAAAFGRGQHRQAACLFSEALKFVDEEHPGEGGAYLAARLYANRALCLTKLQPPALEAALQDASAAVALDPAYPKALYRRACVLRALGRGSSAGAVQDAHRALQLLQEQQAGGGDVAEAEALLAELEAEAAAAEAAENAGGSGGGGPAAEAANGVHSGNAIAAAAAAADNSGDLVRLAAPQLMVQETQDAGRCLVAAAELPPGNDVLRERPFAHTLTKSGRRSVCATCMAPLAQVAAPYYCRRCPLPAYCSPACRDADAFHTPGGSECGLPWSMLLPVEAVAALRLARQLRRQGGSGDGGGRSATVSAGQVAGLGTHFAEIYVEEAVQLAALAAVAHATWTQAAGAAAAAAAATAAGEDQPGSHTHSSGSSSDDGSDGDITAGDVLGALCRLQINGLAVVPPERRGAEDRIGLALYPVGALMNHACQPTTAVRFEGSQLVVRTLKPLAPGEPVLHCYGPQAGEMTAGQRQQMLSQQYHFLCRCHACASAASNQLADTAPAGLKCRGSASGARCDGAVRPACAVPEGLLHRYPLPAGSGACCTCGTSLSQQLWEEEVLPGLQAAAYEHASAAALLEQHERSQQQQQQQALGAPPPALQAVRALRQCLRQRQQHLHPHNLLLGSTHNALAHAWHLAGNDEAAADHLRHSLVVLQHAYPAASTAVAFQQRQLAQALRMAAVAAAAGANGGAAAAERLLGEARQAEEEADAVLQLHFGSPLA